jgi:hypothetical protein
MNLEDMTPFELSHFLGDPGVRPIHEFWVRPRT